MRQPFLTGSKPLTLDKKSRLMVPSDYRRVLPSDEFGDAFYVVLGRDSRMLLFPERWYESLYRHMATTTAAQSASGQRSAMLFFAMAERVEMDKQGRVILPPWHVGKAKLEEQVTLAGFGDHLELWNTPEFEQYRERISDQSNELHDVELRRTAVQGAGDMSGTAQVAPFSHGSFQASE